MATFKILCEQCDNETTVEASESPQLCPCCGEEIAPEIVDDSDLMDELDFED